MKICHFCGNIAENTDCFCMRCGTDLRRADTSQGTSFRYLVMSPDDIRFLGCAKKKDCLSDKINRRRLL